MAGKTITIRVDEELGNELLRLQLSRNQSLSDVVRDGIWALSFLQGRNADEAIEEALLNAHAKLDEAMLSLDWAVINMSRARNVGKNLEGDGIKEQAEEQA